MPKLVKWTIASLSLNTVDLEINFLAYQPSSLTGEHLVLKLADGVATVEDSLGVKTSPTVEEAIVKWAEGYFTDYMEYLNSSDVTSIIFEIKEKEIG